MYTLAAAHREAPGIAADPAIDTTDLYAFVSADRPDTVTLIANYIPLEASYGGPNFFGFADWPAAQDEIHVDNNGDAVDIALRVVAGSLDQKFNVSPNNELGDTGGQERQAVPRELPLPRGAAGRRDRRLLSDCAGNRSGPPERFMACENNTAIGDESFAFVQVRGFRDSFRSDTRGRNTRRPTTTKGELQ